jgi:hypothetical protein
MEEAKLGTGSNPPTEVGNPSAGVGNPPAEKSDPRKTKCEGWCDGVIVSGAMV